MLHFSPRFAARAPSGPSQSCPCGRPASPSPPSAGPSASPRQYSASPPETEQEDHPSTPELGTRQFFSFATTTTRQRNIASGTSQGPEKNLKIVRPQCLDGVATIDIVKWQLQTTLWP